MYKEPTNATEVAAQKPTAWARGIQDVVVVVSIVVMMSFMDMVEIDWLCFINGTSNMNGDDCGEEDEESIDGGCSTRCRY